MARRPRHDEPGMLHHVMNRGIARRTVFESRADVRKFLSLLACCVRRREIEVHSFVVMATHFHLLVRSREGRLSRVMQWIQTQYSRYFNRTRQRDGPLIRGRFLNVPVTTVVHQRTAVRYIDQNPVEAGLVAQPNNYPYGSAQWLRASGPRPRWLSRDLVDGFLGEHAQQSARRETAYDFVFRLELSRRHREWIEKRLTGKARGFDPVDELLGCSQAVRNWALRKARLADGTRPGLPVLDAGTVDEVILASASELSPIEVRAGNGRTRPAAELMRVALLREAAGETLLSVATRMNMNPSTPARLHRLHRRLLQHAPYREAYVALLDRSLHALHG